MTGHPAAKSPPLLAVSIVVYRSDAQWLERTLTSLLAALSAAHAGGNISAARVYLVDNAAATRTSESQPLLDRIFSSSPAWLSTNIIAGQGNCGYGAGHNLAFKRDADAELLLVLNPDVDIDANAISNGIRHLRTNDLCAMITPIATAADASPLYLVKETPAIYTLALRGFAPELVQTRFRNRLAAYERRDEGWDTALTDVRFASGCFMLIRRTTFDLVGGFDETFFLYFEDFDLSYRISQTALIERRPECSIVHNGGGAAAKGISHVWFFVRSALRFFNKHGWRW